MSLCYDFQKWNIITMLALLTVCLVGMINLVYGQGQESSGMQLLQIQNTIREYKMILQYCFDHASDSPNPVRDLVEKGIINTSFADDTCITVKETNQRIWNNIAELVADGQVKDTGGNVLTFDEVERILNGEVVYK